VASVASRRLLIDLSRGNRLELGELGAEYEDSSSAGPKGAAMLSLSAHLDNGVDTLVGSRGRWRAEQCRRASTVLRMARRALRD
jgi:hypothetical protein